MTLTPHTQREAVRFTFSELPSGLTRLQAEYDPLDTELLALKPLLMAAETSLEECLGPGTDRAGQQRPGEYLQDLLKRRMNPALNLAQTQPSLEDFRRYLQEKTERLAQEQRLTQGEQERRELRLLELLTRLAGKTVQVVRCWKCGRPSRVMGDLRYPEALLAWGDPRFTFEGDVGADCGC